MDIADVNTIEEYFRIHKDDILKKAGFEYLNCGQYQWRDSEGKVSNMTDISLRKLKDARKLIIADRDSFVADSARQADISRAIIGNDDEETIAARLLRMLSDKENELREEIHRRP